MYRTSLLALVLLASCAPSRTLVAPPLVTSCDAEPVSRLRVASYNMHAGVGSSLDAIGEVLLDLDADIVALQEVDRGVERTGRVDQDLRLARRLGYHTAFAAARVREGGDFGVAILSRSPFVRVDRIDLDVPLSSQPRVALDASVCVGRRAVRVVAVHADVLTWAAEAGTEVLIDRIRHALGHGVLVAGDLNVTPGSLPTRRLREVGLHDLVGRFGEDVTFTDFRERRLDYIFADAPLFARARAAGVLRAEGSDHFPVFSEFVLDRTW